MPTFWIPLNSDLVVGFSKGISTDEVNPWTKVIKTGLVIHSWYLIQVTFSCLYKSYWINGFCITVLFLIAEIIKQYTNLLVIRLTKTAIRKSWSMFRLARFKPLLVDLVLKFTFICLFVNLYKFVLCISASKVERLIARKMKIFSYNNLFLQNIKATHLFFSMSRLLAFKLKTCLFDLT